MKSVIPAIIRLMEMFNPQTDACYLSRKRLKVTSSQRFSVGLADSPFLLISAPPSRQGELRDEALGRNYT